MPRRRYPLPRRFNAALSESAYAKLRALNQRYGYGNNYLLTILLENLDSITDPAALDQAFVRFEKEYGAPAGGGMKGKGGGS
jgi:hypothetical protein